MTRNLNITQEELAWLGVSKPPPQAIDIEEAVLSAILLEKSSQNNLLGRLSMDDFFDGVHRDIFKACQDLWSEQKPIDLRILREQLSKTKKLADIGGLPKLVEISSKVSSAENAEHHIVILKEKRMLRDLIKSFQEGYSKAYEDDADPWNILDNLKRYLLDSGDGLAKGSVERHIREGIEHRTMDISRRTDEQDNKLKGISSGYENVDKITQGWQPGHLIILAARPSMGKTTVTLNFAANAAVLFQAPVGVFSLEMTYQELVDKTIATHTSIELRKITRKKFDDADWMQYQSSVGNLMSAPIFIDDTSAISITDLRFKARRMVEKYGVKVIFIDYLQLMKGKPGRQNKNREQEISEISSGLKALAKELGIPVVALSQLSREVDKRPDKKPILSDLRESGSLEQDADIVMFLMRPAYYNFTSDSNGTFIPGLVLVMISKNRHGPTGETFLRADLAKSKVMNVDSAYMSAQLPPQAVSNKKQTKNSGSQDGFIHDNPATDDIPF